MAFYNERKPSAIYKSMYFLRKLYQQKDFWVGLYRAENENEEGGGERGRIKMKTKWKEPVVHPQFYCSEAGLYNCLAANTFYLND